MFAFQQLKQFFTFSLVCVDWSDLNNFEVELPEIHASPGGRLKNELVNKGKFENYRYKSCQVIFVYHYITEFIIIFSDSKFFIC